jgi:hypothetical protein
MKIMLGVLLLLVTYEALMAQDKFPMGPGVDKWGVPLEVPSSDLKLRLGGRFQSLMTVKESKNLDADTEETYQDFYARRVRFQFQAAFRDQFLYYMDIRNDNANKNDEGEKAFNIGDAYVAYVLDKNANHALRFFRAKVDVSRSQTVSSSELLFLNRATIADEAAHFVSHNRRATNIQILGNFQKKLSYQFVLGDGVYHDNFSDAKGNKVDKIVKQNFMLGGKLRFSPFEGWTDSKPSETYFGEGQRFSLGAGLFNTSNIEFLSSDQEGKVSRTLVNTELTLQYKEWLFLSEYFHFDGVIEDHTATVFNKGQGEGYFTQVEKLWRDFYYLSLFYRHEEWDKFISSRDYKQISNILGVNWYLNGNRMRLTLAVEATNSGRDISSKLKKDQSIHLASMWHF